MNEVDFFAKRGFGNRIGFGHRPALIAIDLICAFTDPELPLGADLDIELAATNRLIDAFSKTDAPVIFTTVSYSDANLMDAGIWRLKQKGLTTLMETTGGTKLDPRLNRPPNSQLITKKYASSFFGTDLLSRLVSMNIDTVFLAGCTTSGCVRATAVDAIQNGFRPMVVREAVGDRSVQAHEQSLFDLEAKYADVIGLEEALDNI